MMTRPEVVYTSDLPGSVERLLADEFDVAKLVLRDLGPHQFLEQLGEPRGIVPVPGDPFNADLIEALPASVRVMASYSTGLDHIDLDAAKRRGIAVTNTPDVLTDATADVAVLLILAVLRGARDGIRDIDSRTWSGWSPAAVYGRDLRGLTVGIAGPGRIGVAVAERVRAFGMSVVYWGRRRAAAMDAAHGEFVADFQDFLAASDVVSLHVPSTSATRHIINRTALAHVRPGTVLINTARGDLLDDDAVIDAVHSGTLGGVGLDVFSNEPNIDARYYDLPRSVLLPHIGSATHETRAAMGGQVLASLVQHIGPRQAALNCSGTQSSTDEPVTTAPTGHDTTHNTTHTAKDQT